MKSSVLRYFAIFASLALVFAGCKTAYDASGGGGGTATGDTTSPSSSSGAAVLDDGGGVFPDGSHDVIDGVPPSIIVDETEGVKTASHFRAIQIDPALEDTAGPKFILHGDVDQDGLVDLVTGWNQSQPVQLHLQRPSSEGLAFEAITLVGTMPVAVIGGLDLADLNGDGWLDVALAIKHTGAQAFCGDATETWCGLTTIEDSEAQDADVGEVMILFNPGTAEAIRHGERWAAVAIHESVLDGRRDQPYERAQRAPEWNSYTALKVGDLDCDGLPDIAVCFNPAPCEEECEEFPVNRLVMYSNPGTAGSAAAWAGAWADVEGDWIYAASGPIIKDLALDDVDDDGALDVILTHPDQASPNILWGRNLCGAWDFCPVGHVDTQADVITVGDVDGDGFNDVLVRSNEGKVVQWFKRPTDDGTEPIFPPETPPNPDRVPPTNQAFCSFPWPVFTVAEFEVRTPEGITLGDVTGDGQVEAIVAAGGAVFWFEYDPEVEGGLYDLWIENFVVDDSKAQGQTVDPTDPDFEDKGTFINALTVLDLDGDGYNDILATFDRRTGSGLADDELIWFRNTKFDSGE